MFTREHVVAGVLGLLALFLVFLIAHDVVFPPTPATVGLRTATVSSGTIRSAVSGTGTVVPVTQQNLSFGETGTISEIDVKVGDHVTAGQVLARLDPTTLQQAVDQASNSLQQAQATLNTTVSGNAIVQAQHSLAAAQQSYTDAVNSANLTNQQDANTVANDQNQIASDAPMTADQVQQDQASLNTCLAATPTSCSSLQQKLTQDQAALSRLQQDQQKLVTDQNKQAVDQLATQRSVNQAAAQVTSAQDQLNSQTIQRPNTIASQQAAVANAQLAVQTAQRNLDNATLKAPFGGVVLAVNGQVGESSSSGSAATSLAPGSTAPLPSGAGSSGSTGASGGSGTTGSTAGASSGVISLGDLSALQVVAPFAEADAARLQPNQQATVTFDAVQGLDVPAHVLSVAAGATVISNVTNYYATLVLDRIDPRLKSGMTANASVVVQQVSDVLVLPNSAITRVGGTAFVTLLGKDGKTQTRQPVQTGTVGDTTTAILSGLEEGDKVVLPQLRVPTTGAAGAAPRIGGGGGGAGGGGGVRVGGG